MDFVRQLAGTLSGAITHHGHKDTGNLPSPHSDDLQDSHADQATHQKREEAACQSAARTDRGDPHCD